MKNVLKANIVSILLMIISIDFIYSGCCCEKESTDNNIKNKSSKKTRANPGKIPGKPGVPANPVDNNITVTIRKKEGDNYINITTIEIDKNTTVADLKFEIFKFDNSFLSKKQKLTYNGVLLADDKKTLIECNINNGAVIIVEVEENEEDVNINVRTSTGESFNISVKPSETILELKSVVLVKLGGGHNINNIKLIYAGMQLDNSRAIKDYNIKNSDDKTYTPTIHVVIWK